MTFPTLRRFSHLRTLVQALGLCLLGVFLGCAQNDPGTKGGVTGSGGSSTAIRLDKSSITLQGVSNSATLPTTSLIATYSGTTPVVGFPAGTATVTWISVQKVTDTGGVATYTVSAATTAMAPGTYTTTLRFATAMADGSSPVYVDLPITYTLTATIVAGEAAPAAGEAIPAKASEAQAALAQATGIGHLVWATPAE